MRTSSRMLCVGGLAATRLQHGPLTVLTVFERSLYAEDFQGKLVCLCRGDLEPGPLNILCEPWVLSHTDEHYAVHKGDRLDCVREQPEDSQPVRISIHGPDRLRVLWGGETVRWQPDPLLPVERDVLVQGLQRLRACLPALMPAEGLAELLFVVLDGTPCPDRVLHPARLRVALLEEGGQGLASVQDWLLSREATHVRTAVSRLLGLGPGLTPSGDDVLGGVLVALRALGEHEAAVNLAEQVQKEGKRTHRISLAHLEAAAEGSGARGLHRALQSLCNNAPDLEKTLARLQRIGHSSGWDALTGVVLVLQSVVKKAP